MTDRANLRKTPPDGSASRVWVRLLHMGVVCTGWASVVMVAANVKPPASLRPFALFSHLVFLTIGFGAVLAVEVNGLALLLRRIRNGRFVAVALSVDPLIWLGLVGMCASGVLLGPRLDHQLTVVKLILVLVVALNGVWARDLVEEMRRLPMDADSRTAPRSLLARAFIVSAISQAGWWGALVIGFLTTTAAD